MEIKLFIFWAFWIILIALFSSSFFIAWCKKKKSLFILESREILTNDEIYLCFYASSNFKKESVIALWQEISDTFEIPMGKLRPTDRFGIDIGVYWGLSVELDILDGIIQRRYKNLKITTKQDLINTVDDYIKRFADKK